MIKSSLDDMLMGRQSRYALVIAVAKRARELSEEMAEGKIEKNEKPVLVAYEEFKNHKYAIYEAEVDD
ncbi:MAG: DNA-directed RNA polymerase subunit omega [Candidatus Pseudoruminococcus sp.]|uniref:DNA-directed RNA polymerase subunit omega n=1 Tax=Candidatus Pseudoruminococcus sp. TaxID=3101048 RepID=UPI002A7CD0DE|nr:DNA-directed RNA polymerase subunit omega [Ruminococcus sp.]MDY2781836.1 DNA-directed RNA polymerase subunit omega [Candidatus Pseudoruminococcus sp.]